MKKVFGVLFIFSLLFISTACGSKELTSPIATYEILEIESSSGKISIDELTTLNIKMELIIKDSENATLSLDGSEEVLTYNDSEFIGKHVETGELEIIPYTIDGNKMILEKDGEKLIFEKK